MRILVALLLVFVGSALAQEISARLPEKHLAVFDNYCLDCHDRETEKGDTNLEDLALDLALDLQTAETWQKVLNSINSGEMPPEDKKQIANTEKAAFLEALSKKLVSARSILSDSGGVITMRRLNRREYQNTIRDLLGVQIDVEDLPDDSEGQGFDTAGASLFFSSDQFERYLEIARRAVGEAMDPRWETEGLQKKVFRVEAEAGANRKYEGSLARLRKVKAKVDARRAEPDRPATDFGFIDNDRVKFELGGYQRTYPAVEAYLANPLHKTGALMVTDFSGATRVSVSLGAKALPGRYRLTVRAAPVPGSEPHQRFLELGRKQEGAQGAEMEVLDCRALSGSPTMPDTVTFTVDVPISGQREFLLRARQQNSRDAMRYRFQQAKAENGIGPAPTIWLDWAEWEGPISDAGVPTFRERFLEGKDPLWKHDREILADFARAAFRGVEPTDAFLDKLDAFIKDQIKTDGMKHGKALQEALAIILSSPSFLYLTEGAEDGKPGTVSDLELASRLSYFLWSAPPDEELLGLVRGEGLQDKRQVIAQADRLLADPRARDFIAGFAHQWLDMKRLDFFQFSPRRFPEFDDSLREAAREEIYQMLLRGILEDWPARRLLDSDTVLINDLLAGYYGIDGVKGSGFRPVSVPEGNPRGGLLATAAVLAMGSDGERSSPVERGSWVLRHLLHDPPPPAPANVPQLTRFTDPHIPVRELQKAHQEEPQCAQCHRSIDPIGFGMENFDAAGKWREMEITEGPAKKGKGKGKTTRSHEIDASGTLPGGEPFADFFELRQRIAGKEEAFARSYTEALIAFGLGRPYGFTDLDLADEILAAARKEEYSLRAFIHALVRSEAFRRK